MKEALIPQQVRKAACNVKKDTFLKHTRQCARGALLDTTSHTIKGHARVARVVRLALLVSWRAHPVPLDISRMKVLLHALRVRPGCIRISVIASVGCVLKAHLALLVHLSARNVPRGPFLMKGNRHVTSAQQINLI